MRVALMTDVPDQTIVRGIEQVVQGDGDFDRTEAGGEVAAGARQAFD